MFGRKTAKKISISTTDQLSDTNRNKMEHLSLSAITIWSKDLKISSAQLGDNIIVNSNQSRTYIDRRGHYDWYLPFGIQKIGNGMSVDFRWNTDDKIGMNL